LILRFLPDQRQSLAPHLSFFFGLFLSYPRYPFSSLSAGLRAARLIRVTIQQTFLEPPFFPGRIFLVVPPFSLSHPEGVVVRCYCAFYHPPAAIWGVSSCLFNCNLRGSPFLLFETPSLLSFAPSLVVFSIQYVCNGFPSARAVLASPFPDGEAPCLFFSLAHDSRALVVTISPLNAPLRLLPGGVWSWCKWYRLTFLSLARTTPPSLFALSVVLFLLQAFFHLSAAFFPHGFFPLALIVPCDKGRALHLNFDLIPNCFCSLLPFPRSPCDTPTPVFRSGRSFIPC